MREKEIKKQEVQEDLADLAHKVEQDHEIQLARAELYKAAKYSIKLHEMMKTMSEEEGLDGWVSAKITKASDYLSTVYHHLDYATKFDSAGVVEGQKNEGGMPTSVIKSKQKYADMSDEELANHFKGKDEKTLRQMAWRHGYGKMSSHYVNRIKKEGREDNPAPDMNKYGIHTTKFKGEPFKVFQHNKQVAEFDSIEEVNKFLTDLVNKESTYKETLHNKLKDAVK